MADALSDHHCPRVYALSEGARPAGAVVGGSILIPMAYDEELAERIRHLLEGEPGLTERRMFGGLGFMIEGHMALTANSGGELMVRVDPTAGVAWVDGTTVRPAEMHGRSLSGWLVVAPDVLHTESALELWVERGLAHVRTLPPKPGAATPK